MARENTTNRGYRLPVPSTTTDWGNILNDETFEDIDEDVRNSRPTPRTEDPDSPSVGDMWYRSDLNVVRYAIGDSFGGVQVVESRAVYGVPSETDVKTIEDFEGASISDFQTQVFQGTASFDIVEYDGSDQLRMTVSEDSQGIVAVGSSSTAKATATVSVGAGNWSDFNVFYGSFPGEGPIISAGYDEVLQEIQAFYTGNQTGNSKDIGENIQKPITVTVELDESGILASFEGGDGSKYEVRYNIKPSSLGDKLGVFGRVEEGEQQTEYYIDDVISGGDAGQISPPIPHSDLADAPPSAHHVRPTAGAGIREKNDTFRAKYPIEDLSQRTGNYDGEPACDDGTNTPVRGTLCVWDANNTVWRPQNDPDTGSF